MPQKQYTLKEESKGIFALKANGHYQTCPFQHPTPVPKKLGGFDLVGAVCTSQCPHFRIDNSKTDSTISDVELCCAGMNFIDIVGIEMLPEAPKSSLIIT